MIGSRLLPRYLCLLIAANSILFQCHGWSVPKAFQQQGHHQSSAKPSADNTIICNSQQNAIWHEQLEKQNRIVSRFFGSAFVAAALVFGSVTNPDAALASSADETLLYDLSSQDSKVIESKAPPETKSASSEQALVLSKKLKSLNGRMYGAYWCGHCANQKETFGKEAFDSKTMYVECSENGENSQAALCEEKNVNGYPTWEIKNKFYSGERTLDEMETLVRMAENSGNNDKAPPSIVTKSSDRALAISKQLESFDARLYGSYWCAHTFEQKEALGKKAFAKIPYIECGQDGVDSQLQLCQEKKIRVVPTWEIKGELYPGGQDLDELEQIIIAVNGQAAPESSSDTTSAEPTTTEAAPSKDTDKEEEPQKVVDDSAIKAKEDTKTSEETAANEKEEQDIAAKETPPPQQTQDVLPQSAPAVTASDNPVVSSSNRATVLATNMQELPDTRIYGAYWDAFTKHQKQALGDEAFDMIPYVECTKDGKNSQTKLCKEKGIKAFPTFEIGGKVYSAGERSLVELETLVDKAYESVSKTKPATLSPPTPPKNIAPVPAKSPLGPPPIKAKSTDRSLALARQMESLDTKMYGAYWCKHCLSQKEVLGKQAFEKIQYIECTKDGKNSQNELCREKGIRAVPTWEINGKLFSGERSFEELDELVKFELPPAPTEVKSTDTVKAEDATSADATTTKSKATAAKEDEKGAPDMPTFTLKLPQLMPPKDESEKSPPVATSTEDQKEQSNDEKVAPDMPTFSLKLPQLIPSKDESEKSPPVATSTEDQNEQSNKEENAGQPASTMDATTTIGTEATPNEKEKSNEDKAPPAITSLSSPRALKVADDLEKFDAKLYGAYWCRYTNAQKERLGKEAFSKIQYIECSQDGKDSAVDTCRKMRIQGYPTWEINGVLHPGDQELEELEAIVEGLMDGL